MKKVLSVLLVLALLLGWAGPANALAASQNTIPTFSITQVAPGVSVTIQTNNFPANDTFDLLMGQMGTRGVNGTKVTSIASGKGGSFSATFNIPAALKDNERIAIRLQSSTGSGYYAFNWFWNKAGGTGTGGAGNGTSGSSGIPVFFIQSVDRDKTVTIQTKNFPANETFQVRMGKMGTRGVNGIKGETFDSGSGGVLTKTFAIPAGLQGLAQISIRLESTSGSGYYAYNWFWNNTTGSGTGGVDDNGGTPASGYKGYPTFTISSVVRNTSVTVAAKNLPSNDTFKVTMGKMGTRGVNGYTVTTVSTGAGGAQNFTFTIPAELKDLGQISIRMESPTSGYYAFNWFYNNNAN